MATEPEYPDDPLADPYGPAPFQSDEEPAPIENEDQGPDPGTEAEDIGSELQDVAEQAIPTDEPETDIPDSVPSLDTDPTPDIPPAPDSVTDASDLPDMPTETAAVEAPAPDFDELDQTQQQLQSFGEQVNAFNDAGGADSAGGFTDAFNGDSSGTNSAMQEFGDAVVRNTETTFEFMREHARMIDAFNRKMEAERL